MPIDPSLITDTMARWQAPAPVQVMDPLAQYAKIQALKNGIVQQQIQQQTLQSGALDLQEKQKTIQDQDALNGIYKQAYEVDPGTGQLKLNEDKLYSGMAAGGQGAKIPATQRAITEANKTAIDMQKARADANKATQDYLGQQLLDIQDAGYDPTTFTAKIAAATNHGAMQPAEAAKLIQQFQQNPTSAGVKALVDPYITASTSAQEILTKRATAKKDIGEADKAAGDLAREKENQRLAKVNAGLAAAAAAETPDQLEAARTAVITGGGTPDEVKRVPGALDPAAQGVLRRSLLTPEQQTTADAAAATLKATQAAQKETARHNKMQESIELTRNQLQQTAARGDRSYQSATHELDQIGKPVADAVTRLSKLQDTLAQNSPQADALVAPELLSVMAGGAGSGLRMNEAEISRIVGGRSKWQDLQAAINKWQLDPSKANSITPDQRQQIRNLVQTVSDKIYAKQTALDAAYKTVAGSQDPNEHRQAVLAARQAVTAADQGGGAVPDAVKKALSSAGPGIHTLSDGSKWMTAADGTITPQK